MADLLGARVGHWTGDGTGVTVILPPPGAVGSGEVRGGAPATREFELLDPTRLVNRVDAVVLSGGSAFGLASGNGLMGWLRDRGTGFETPLGPVPIVVGMSIFDGSVTGTPPDDSAGREAALAALRGEPFTMGRVGAGTGATTGKWRNRLDPGGIGWAILPVDPGAGVGGRPAAGAGSAGPTGTAGVAEVAAVVVVNAWGDVLGPDGRPLFGRDEPAGQPAPAGFQNTTVGCLLTTARLSKSDCFLLAQSGHTGIARAIHPAHSRYDGDAMVALATGAVTDDVNLDLLRALAADAVIAAIRAAVS
jgi:L-aminopeptidase/D-esterase-like protein